MITHNMLRCNKRGVENGFPLAIEPREVEQSEADFNAEFIVSMLDKLEWRAFAAAAVQLGLEPFPAELAAEMKVRGPASLMSAMAVSRDCRPPLPAPPRSTSDTGPTRPIPSSRDARIPSNSCVSLRATRRFFGECITRCLRCMWSRGSWFARRAGEDFPSRTRFPICCSTRTRSERCMRVGKCGVRHV